MRHATQRKTAPGVVDGRVRKKNHWGPTDDPFASVQPSLRLEQSKPGPGYRHIVSLTDLKRFIEIIPDWAVYSKGLDLIRLAAGRVGRYGTYWYGYTDHGVIYLRAWPGDLHDLWSDRFFTENRAIVEKLGIPFEQEQGYWYLHFTEATAKAFMLMDVFLHELGHHHDRMRTRSRADCPGGEPYAEKFAAEMASGMWDEYFRRFPVY